MKASLTDVKGNRPLVRIDGLEQVQQSGHAYMKERSVDEVLLSWQANLSWINGSQCLTACGRFAVLAAVLSFGVTLAGCQVSRVSTYDPETDRAVTELQQDIDMYLTTLEMLAEKPKSTASLKQPCDPEQFADVYRKLNAKLRTLTLRNEARDRNQLTVDQLHLLRENLSNLQSQQKLRYATQAAAPGDRCLGMGQLQVNRNSLEQIIRAILTLELAKREFREGE